MNDTDWAEVHRLIDTNPLELAHRYIALLDAPEPVYEYRVVCADGEERARQRVLGCGEAEVLRESVESLPWPRCPCGKFPHTVERRVIGPWEAT
jgi:hypothetical protein